MAPSGAAARTLIVVVAAELRDECAQVSAGRALCLNIKQKITWHTDHHHRAEANTIGEERRGAARRQRRRAETKQNARAHTRLPREPPLDPSWGGRGSRAEDEAVEARLACFFVFMCVLSVACV